MAHASASAALASSGFAGATAPYYQNLLQSMNNEAAEHQARNAATSRNVDKDILLDDLYKIISASDPTSSNFAEAHHGRVVENGGYQFPTQLTDNFDLSGFSGETEAAAWFALQQQRNQMQANGYSDHLAAASNRRMEQQLAMMPNQLAMMPNHHAAAAARLQAQAPIYGVLGNAQGNVPFSGTDQSSLLAALLSEPTGSVGLSQGNSSGPHPSQSTTSAAASKTNGADNNNNNNYKKSSGSTMPKAPPPKSAQPQPFRALSAYNFFFRDERDRIINGGEYEFSTAKKQKLLTGHWFRDRTVKRRHRKTHGKIAFTTLSKVISQGWRDLPEDKKAFYREVAAEDLDRYQRELDQYKMVEAQGAVDGSNTMFATEFHSTQLGERNANAS